MEIAFCASALVRVESNAEVSYYKEGSNNHPTDVNGKENKSSIDIGL